MLLNVQDSWKEAPESLSGILKVSELTWRLVTGYVVPEVLIWFGQAAKVVSQRVGSNPVKPDDVEAVVRIIDFPIDPKKWEAVPLFGKVEYAHQVLKYGGVIRDPAEFDAIAHEALLRIASKSVELTLLRADFYATSEKWPAIYNRHVLRGCDESPYPLNLIIC